MPGAAGCNDQLVVLPLAAGRDALLHLEPPVCCELLRQGGVDRDNAPDRAFLPSLHFGPSLRATEPALDAHDLLREIDVAPLQPDQLTASQAVERGESQRWPPPMLFGDGEGLAEI